MREFKSVVPRDKAFFLKTRHDNVRYADRVNMAAFRYFDRETGEMKIEKISLSEEEREEFNIWFSWYGSMIHIYRDEIKAFLRKDKRYKLDDIDLPADLEW